MLNDVLHSEDNLQLPRAFLQHFGGGDWVRQSIFSQLKSPTRFLAFLEPPARPTLTDLSP